MITFKHGNLLQANTEALVNTVNTVGVMGKGIALMFKEAFPENFKIYAAACKRKDVRAGHLFVTERQQLIGPKWIINFATKDHWRSPSRMEWIESGLTELRSFIIEQGIKSIALPPLGSGNGGLSWTEVRPRIEAMLADLPGVEVQVFEPTPQYQNVAKREGVDKLTVARALIAEAVRRYSALDMESTLLEVQKLGYFLERAIEKSTLPNPLNLQYGANRFGPFSPKLSHLLNSLDGSYLHCGKRLADASPSEMIWFERSKSDRVALFLATEAKEYEPLLSELSETISGFESPLNMELLSTVDWLLHKQAIEPNVQAVKRGLQKWPGGTDAGARKLKLFPDRLIVLALQRLQNSTVAPKDDHAQGA